MYECPIQRTLPCKSWNYPSQAVYLGKQIFSSKKINSYLNLESRKCDGIMDCVDGSDEDPEICARTPECQEIIILIGIQFLKSAEVNGHSYFVSFDERAKLCFHINSLIGHGYWIVMENVPGQENLCETSCGALTYAEHNFRERCVEGTIFNKWTGSLWQRKC